MLDHGSLETEGVDEAQAHRNAMRHSTAHVMADAVLKLFPEAKMGIGPPVENGFYYDFEVSRPFTPEDLEEIEKLMKETIKEGFPFQREELSRADAETMFSDQPYKMELIEGLPGEEVISIYRHDEFVDLCQGPHVRGTSDIPAMKLLSVAGAYWRGDEKRPMLQRIYGTAFESEQELAEHLERLEEAERRDHRTLGRQLNLFSIHEEIGPGLIVWHPKGGRVRSLVEDYWKDLHYRLGYDIVYSPHIGRAQLWETSGHLDFYQEGMFAPLEVDEQQYYLKPMNCPFHIAIFKNALHSYRELPLRFAELGTVYRYERSGVLHGLMRVRGFTQDDAHIFCTPDQVEDEVGGVLELTFELLDAFGFKDYSIALSTRPEKYVGDPEMWEHATKSLQGALEKRSLPFTVGRAWQSTTVQFDFNLPHRFDLTYQDAEGGRSQPYMVHRAILGSMERFLGVLIEHYGGAFPLWLAPVQAVLIPIADRHIEYCESVLAKLEAAGFRAEVDTRGERMNQKIRTAQMQKVPYMLVVGDREQEANAVAVRHRDGEDLGAVPLDEFMARLGEESVIPKGSGG